MARFIVVLCCHTAALQGVHQVFKHYMQISSQCHTVALRDYYPGRLVLDVRYYSCGLDASWSVLFLQQPSG